MSTLYDELASHRENKHDKKVFGLVLQGGGMRGVYSAGAIAPLIQYGFTGTFDHVVGSSAGAINGAYFLGEDIETYHTYTDDLTNKNFVNLLRQNKKVDIDYLVDLVLKHKRPVNVQNLKNSSSKLHVVMTNARTGRKAVLTDHHDFSEIYEEFRATAALPLLYDKSVRIDNTEYVDGGVADLLPVDIAVKLGCTDIVVVMTQLIKNYHFDKRHDRLVNHLIKKYARKHTKKLRDVLPYNERSLQMNLRLISRPNKKIRFYILEPSSDSFLIGLATVDKTKVENLARQGIDDMDLFLHKELFAI